MSMPKITLGPNARHQAISVVQCHRDSSYSLFKAPHPRHFPLSGWTKVLCFELWCARLIFKEEVVVGFDSTHCLARLDGFVVQDNAVVAEAEACTPRHD